MKFDLHTHSAHSPDGISSPKELIEMAKKNGLFGCDKCHTAFGEHISNLLKQIPGTDIYEGKLPDELSGEGEKIQKLGSLRSELKRCIELEDYERAAKLRDRISEIEGKIITK